ncbi:GNAT family N-acetyltransferase [Chryseobacterium sp. MYb264]|uniref:GNAT family N-acetyltransferase n=1 Tax=Chryseobacterium sp. MYb264 TaxID=2745153 RepID=UPI002E1304C9|nr:GNAT family N-acetyltransferase [Chryseobacterium sp. MYb264]
MKKKYLLKSFEELLNNELYEILKLRNEVFIVEQNCIYQDIDDKDEHSLHLTVWIDGNLAGYTRLLPSGLSYDDISIGRVITSPKYRGVGLGKELIDKSIGYCRSRWGNALIRISAQSYLLKFYESSGFRAIGEEYEEDGIPHIEMIKPPSD